MDAVLPRSFYKIPIPTLLALILSWPPFPKDTQWIHCAEMRCYLDDALRNERYNFHLTPPIQQSIYVDTLVLADGLANGKLALDDFKNIARDFVSELISEFIRLAVVNNIINSIFGLTGSAALPSFNPFDISGRAGRQGHLECLQRPRRHGSGREEVRTAPILAGRRALFARIPETECAHVDEGVFGDGHFHLWSVRMV